MKNHSRDRTGGAGRNQRCTGQGQGEPPCFGIDQQAAAGGRTHGTEAGKFGGQALGHHFEEVEEARTMLRIVAIAQFGEASEG